MYNQTYSDYGSYRLQFTDGVHSGSTAWHAQDGDCVCPPNAFACQGSEVPKGPAVIPSWPHAPGETAATLPLLPNRKYLVIAVIRTDFPRLTTEINLGVVLWGVVDDGFEVAPLVGAVDSSYIKRLSNHPCSPK